MLVTGGNRGIGRAIAEAFLAQGDKVAVTTRNGGAPEGALDVRCDITDPAAVDAAFAQVEEAHGPVEVLVANAGITHDTLLLRMSRGRLVLGHRHQPHRLLPARQARRQGHAAAASAAGSSSSPRSSGCSARPARSTTRPPRPASSGMARSLARELGSRSITANVVAPGFVETDMTDVLTDDQKAAIKTQVPLGRYATPDEVASAVTWLASDGAAYVTGAVIPVDGGLGMGH